MKNLKLFWLYCALRQHQNPLWEDPRVGDWGPAALNQFGALGLEVFISDVGYAGDYRTNPAFRPRRVV